MFFCAVYVFISSFNCSFVYEFLFTILSFNTHIFTLVSFHIHFFAISGDGQFGHSLSDSFSHFSLTQTFAGFLFLPSGWGRCHLFVFLNFSVWAAISRVSLSYHFVVRSFHCQIAARRVMSGFIREIAYPNCFVYRYYCVSSNFTFFLFSKWNPDLLGMCMCEKTPCI